MFRIEVHNLTKGDITIISFHYKDPIVNRDSLLLGKAFTFVMQIPIFNFRIHIMFF